MWLAQNGSTALELARRVEPDVVLLDPRSPGVEGFELCRVLRTFTDCYVVMLTAYDDELDRLVGLSIGADDYLVKPIGMRELVARIRAMLRRPRTMSTPFPDSGDEAHPWVWGPLTVDFAAREVFVDGLTIDLTRTEFDVLAALAARPRTAFSRRQIIETVWGGPWVADEHLVDVHIGHVRRKLGDCSTTPTFIQTVRGIGYRLAPVRAAA